MKKLLSVVLALILVLGLAMPAFADGTTKPTAHTTVTSLDGVSSVTVNGTPAYYEYDSNTGSSAKYIRAELPKASATEYSLKNATVVITTTGSTASIPGYTATVSGNQYTFTSVNLFNTAYTVSVGSYSYTLAAGIEDGRVEISSGDPLGLSGTLNGVVIDVFGNNQNNPYMGNPYYSSGWTFINYFVSGTLPSGTSLNNVTGSFTVASGATFSGPASTVSGPFNFISNNIITITNGGSRQYNAQLAISGQTVTVKQKANGYRNYDINLTEVKASTYYEDDAIKAKVDSIETAWNVYISSPHVFASGSTVMDIMIDFINWAESNYITGTTMHYFTGSSETSGGTYLSKLNGLDAFDCGYMAGYVYSDDPNGYYYNNNGHSSMANVGANDYLFTSTTRIVWFYTVDYSNWFNW